MCARALFDAVSFPSPPRLSRRPGGDSETTTTERTRHARVVYPGSIDRFNDAAHWREALTTPFVTRKVLSSPPSLFTSVLPGGREKRGKPTERRTDGRGDGSNRERE